MSARILTTAALATVAIAAACARRPQTPPAAPEGMIRATPRPESLRVTPRIDTAPPALGAPAALTLPPVTTRTLSNGLTLHVVEQHELPIADLVLVVKAGAERDPARHAGLATMTADLLTEGTTSRSSLEIADQAAYLGVELDAGSGWDASRLVLHTPTAQLDSALALFADVALHPSFPAKELERVRRERLTTLLQRRDLPRAIADEAFADIVFSAKHPYGRPLLGTEASTKAITRGDVQRFYRASFVPNNAALIVVGDVRADDVAARVERLFGAWKKGKVTEPMFSTTPTVSERTVYLIDKPNAPQSSVRIGGVGVARSTTDYFPLLVMNTILGGSFSSRLNQNLRETHGYTYGARSGFDMRQVPGPFAASAEVTGTKTDSALVEFFKELNGIREAVPAQELERAKRYLQLQLPSQFETTGGVASRLVPLVLYGLPLDYYNSYAQRIEGVTAADVQRVARQYVDPGKAVVVVVGDRKSVEPLVRALNLGPVKVRTIGQ